jgi:hypothetical protein
MECGTTTIDYGEDVYVFRQKIDLNQFNLYLKELFDDIDDNHMLNILETLQREFPEQDIFKTLQRKLLEPEHNILKFLQHKLFKHNVITDNSYIKNMSHYTKMLRKKRKQDLDYIN